MRNKLDTSPEALAEELLGRPYDELDEEDDDDIWDARSVC